MMNRQVSVLYMLAGILFATCLLISNLLATKIIAIGPWFAPAGVLIFPLAYILNDVIVEVWGYRKARLIIWAGFGVNILAAVFFTIGIKVPAAPFWNDQQAFATVLGFTPRIVAASLLAYLTGSFINAFVMSKVKILMKGRNFSVRAVLSTLLGETADSMIFITVAFSGIFPFNTILAMIVTQASLKTIFEIFILPLTMLVVKKIKKIERTDTFDHSISYNPFRISQI